MLVRFSCTSFAPPSSCLAVVGNCPELGDWNPERARRMQARLGQGRLQSEPDFHSVDVQLAQASQGAEYKFIEFTGGDVRWEESGPAGNRRLHLDGEKAADVHLLPVEKFGSGASESDHTAAFYSGVKQRGEISVRRVTSQIWIGSCPRSTQHIDYLRSLGITAIANFQSEGDAMKNCVAGIGMEGNAHAVRGEYERRGMQYIWTPTADMCSEGRTQMLPRTSQTFAELLRAGHVIYSHCNAGVGRSVSAVCGYLTFVLGLTDRQMQHVVASSRPAAFFDFDALRRARPKFQDWFGAEVAARARDDEKLCTQRDAAGPALADLPPGTTPVRFSIAHAAQGGRMAVVGGCPALGSWNPAEALVLQGCSQDFHWADAAVPADAGHQVEYKFIELIGDGARWEEFGVGCNRRYEVASNGGGKLAMLPVARFGELHGDPKQREEVMAVIVPCAAAAVSKDGGRPEVPPAAMGA